MLEMFVKSIIALLMSAVASAAIASDWVNFATANDKTTLVEVDKASIVYGTITKVWVRYTFTAASGNKNAGDVEMERWEFNCATHDVKWVESIIHPKFGQASTERGNGSWEPVAPDSMNDAILTAVCKRKAAKQP
jgi:hypothetical protein